MKAGTTRAKDHVLSISMAVADIDTEGEKDKATGRVLSVLKPAPPLDALPPAIQDYTWVAHSSHWHKPRRDVHKYRIVFPLVRPCTPEEWPQVWEGLNILLGGHCDAACKDASQLYYLPSCPAASAVDAFCEANDGKLLDPDALIELARRSVAPPSAVIANGNLQALAAPPEAPEQIERVKSMLAILAADCPYPQWRDVVWSVAATGWHCAEALAQEWSQSAPLKFDENKFRSVFRSYKPDGGVGFGTLIHHAKLAGWLAGWAEGGTLAGARDAA